jgi:hypothetical protein
MLEKRRTEEKGNDFLGIDTTRKNPVQIKLEWFENHYRGLIPQLRVKASWV